MGDTYIKNLIEKKYKSINDFIEKSRDKIEARGFSRTNLYALAQGKLNNPTIKTLELMAELLEMPKEEFINGYINRHRDSELKDKHSN